MKPQATAVASAMVATLGFAAKGIVATTEGTGAFVHTSNIGACLSQRSSLRTHSAVGGNCSDKIRRRNDDHCDGGPVVSSRCSAWSPSSRSPLPQLRPSATPRLGRRLERRSLRAHSGGGSGGGGAGGTNSKVSLEERLVGGGDGEGDGENVEAEGTTTPGVAGKSGKGAYGSRGDRRALGPGGRLGGKGREGGWGREGETGGSSGEQEPPMLQAASSEQGSSSSGGGKSSPSAASTAEGARRRIKRARVALEEALDELGRSAIDELGLAPPAYMDLDFGVRGGVGAGEKRQDGEGKETNEEMGRDPEDPERRPEATNQARDVDRLGWLRKWKKRGAGGGISQPVRQDEVLELFEEVIEEGFEAVGEAVEETFEAVGESVLALDDRVERARASVETALNELGLAIPSASAPATRGHDHKQDGEAGEETGAIDRATTVNAEEPDEAGVAKKPPRWWIPERLRPAALEELAEEEASSPSLLSSSSSSPPAGGKTGGSGGRSDRQQQQQQQQRERSAFFRRSLPLPSIQAQRAVAQRTVKRAKDALGTAIDDLGLTRPPVGSTLERFLHADEVLGLWRQEEALEDQMQNGDEVLPGTDIGNPERRIWVVTTAALPWMTGTSVNPLLRAAYLTRGRDPGKVSLMVPWLGLEDQGFVLPEGHRYNTKEEQGAFIRDWLKGAGMTTEADDLRLTWYDARYHQVAGCIFPMGDITRLIPDDEADVCIMEEPEHLNWFRATGVNWSKKFTHVVGVIHTNYVHYTMADTNHWASGRVKAPFARAFNKIMARAYCDKVIKLSATLQKFAEEKETVTNVHGVRENFLIVGDERAEAAARGEGFAEGDRPYFLGKMLWEKGYGRLWDLLEGYQKSQQQQQKEMGGAGTALDASVGGRNGTQQHTASGAGANAAAGAGAEKEGAGGDDIVLSAYGSGPDSDAIKGRAEEKGLTIDFHPATDHARLSMYKTFVNPSESEVLCTTVAEALAMGKFVVIAEHASNEFFYQFPNTLKFKTQEDFNAQLNYAIENDPLPLTADQRHVLGWSAATDRLVESAKVTVRESLRRRRELDEAAWLFHYYLGSGRRGDRVRKIMAGGVVAGQYAHMELVLKAEREALQDQEAAASAASAASAAAGASAAGAGEREEDKQPEAEAARTGA